MTKNLVIYLLFLLPFLGFSQQFLMVYGTVTNSTTGAPLTNQTVYISTDSSCSSFYMGSATTNANGFYGDTLQIAPLTGSCTLYVTTYGCGLSATQTITITPNTGTTQVNLQLACGGNPTGCSANFVASDSVGWVMCSNLSSGTNGGAYASSWVVDGVGSGNAQNPAFQLAAGMHTICLTISDNTGCTSTYCDSVYVQGGGSNCQANIAYQVSGGTVYLNGYASNTGGAAVSYYWNLGNGSSSTQQYPVVNYGNGTYNVCLTISTSNNCTNTTCQNITITNTPPAGIHGYVFSDSSAFAGLDTMRIWLIQYDSTAGSLTAVDSQTLATNGAAYYDFGSVAGSYLLKAAMLAGPNYATNLPTYYYSSLYWSSANQVQSASINQNMYMIGGVNPGGPGFIGGLVSQGANKMSGAAIAHAEVLLLDMNDNPIAYTYSDATGNFSFSNLAYGTYKVYTEVLNKVTYPVIVTISANHATENGISVEINSTYVAGNVSGMENNAYFQGLKVYPNPTTDNAFVSLNVKQATQVELTLHNIMGQKVWSSAEKMNAGEQEVAVSTQNLPKGIYILKVVANGASQEVKVIKE